MRYGWVPMTRSIKSRVIRIAVGLLFAAACVAASPFVVRGFLYVARWNWKNGAIPTIAKLAEDRAWREKEIKLVATETNDQRVIASGWLTDNLILMENGEWLVYKSHCSKEKPHAVRDIFLAKGSDGNWYYSTFHFCVGMVGLRLEQETQPTSLAAFAHEYNLRQFDGRSDECLKETATWPASWREKKSER